MSALSDYLKKVKHQAALLEAAEIYDIAMLKMERPPLSEGGRHWTRQDRNRLECESKSQMLPRPINEAALGEIWAGVRADTRVWRILRRLGEPSTTEARAEALAANMPYVLPLLDAARKAHARLIEFYRERIFDWGDVEERHNEAIEALSVYADVATKNEQRKIKPTPDTLRIIRLIEKGLDNERINEKTGASVSNIRKVRSILKNDGYQV